MNADARQTSQRLWFWLQPSPRSAASPAATRRPAASIPAALGPAPRHRRSRPPPPSPPILSPSTSASPSSSTGAPQNATSVTIDGIGRGEPQRHPDRLALQLHQLPSHRQGRRRHRPKPTSASPSAFPSLPPPPAAETPTWAARPPSTRTSRTSSSTTTATTSARTAQASVTKAAGYLAAHPAIKLVIGGYCDDRGSAEYNLALGENRANAARTALVIAGIAASRLRVDQLRQGEAVLHRRERSLLAAEPPGPVLTRSLTSHRSAPSHQTPHSLPELVEGLCFWTWGFC